MKIANAVKQIAGLTEELNKTARVHLWREGQAYERGSLVEFQRVIYFCLVKHVSEKSFESEKWFQGNVSGENVSGETVGHIGITLSNIPEGCLTLDTGATIGRTTYPELWEFVQSSRNLLPVVTESQWQTMASSQTSVAAFSTGDGSTTFRLPKLIGWMKGGNEAQVGAAIEAGLPNVTGNWMTYGGYALGAAAMKKTNWNNVGLVEGGEKYVEIVFNASRSNPIYGNSTTVQPAGVTGIYYIRAFHGAVNQGNVDLTEMANELAHKVDTDEMGFAMLYPNGGSKVSPANVAVNSRYILPNPFPGYSVMCISQIQVSSKWVDVGFTGTYAASAQTAYGIFAMQNDESIVIGTGKGALMDSSSSVLSPTPIVPSSNITTAPCRVKVWKIGGKIS